LEAYSKIPEYNNYLTFLFATPTTGSPQDDAIRSVAGLSLKNNLKIQWSLLDPSIINYCKHGVLMALSDQNEMVRKVAGSIITTCVAGGLIERWPEVLPKLVELLERPDTIVVVILAIFY
jgi:transportin-1